MLLSCHEVGGVTMHRGKKISYVFFGIVPLWADQIIENYSPHRLPRYDDKLGQEIAPNLLVLHYTAESLANTQALFAKTHLPNPVSAHYTIDVDGAIFQHVPENLAARHTGVAYWKGLEGPDPSQKKLNIYSIGIEHVNFGFKVKESQPTGVTVQGSDKEWYPFDERQIESSIALCKKILAGNNQIKPYNILGHSDIAPRRKHDPGPLFPWKKFAQHGIGAWPDISKIKKLPCIDLCHDEQCKKNWFMQHLHLWGYRLPDAEVANEDIVRAFHMHFRPENIDGKIDDESITLLKALISEYTLNQGSCPCQKR